MAEILRYVLVDRDNDEGNYEYTDFDEARNDAEKRGCAVVERHYEFHDSELVWTPNGGNIWPPSARKKRP